MYKKIYSDFSSGVNYAKAPLQLGLDSKVTPWAHGLNVEIFCQNGVSRQNGNRLITRNPDGERITALHTFTPANAPDKKKILYLTASGKFYEYDAHGGAHRLVKSGLTADRACVFASFIGGIAVSNGVDAPFFYKGDENGLAGEVCDMKTVAKDGESPILATAMCAYKSRLWLAAGDTLYYSALGTFDDWSSAADAGYISNFHCDAAPVTALRPYKDYLAIYKKSQTYLLSGSSADDFAISPFSDKGAVAQNAVATAANKQFFFCDALFSLEQTGILAQITLGSEASSAIKPIFESDTTNLRSIEGVDGIKYAVCAPLDSGALEQVHLIPYEPKNQLWLYIPTLNNPHLNNIWIYDWSNGAWTLRGLPQPISCAASYGREIISATSDGRILLEDKENTFDGAPIAFEWRSAFLALGNPNCRKAIDDFYFLFSDTVDNRFRFCTFKDYDSLDAQDHETISVSNSHNLVWATEFSDGRQFYWGGEDGGARDGLAVEPKAAARAASDTVSADFDQRWAVPCDIAQKIDISLSCTALQLSIFGDKPDENFAMLALEFKEILEE